MAETGNAKNVANYGQVFNIITALGAAYNPAQELIKLTALQPHLTEAQSALTEVQTKNAARADAVNEREAEFEGLRKLATRIGQAAAVNINDDLVNKDITSIVRKIQGRRAGEKPVDDPSTPDINEANEAHSVSQQSYDNLVAHFAELIALLKTQAAVYKPNETDVKIETLEAKLTAMETKNNAAKIATIAADNAQAARDAILYNEETGIIARVNLIKKYVAYALGKDSAAYQQINALKFKKN